MRDIRRLASIVAFMAFCAGKNSGNARVFGPEEIKGQSGESGCIL